MDSLEFGNLPLIEVTCNLMLAEQRVLEWDDLSQVRAALKDRLPYVSHFFSGLPPVPLGIVLGTEPGATFESNDGVKLEMRPARITSSWRYRGTESVYPRFLSLYDTLETAMSAVGDPHVAIVNMAYTNRAPQEHGAIRDLIGPSAFPGRVQGEVTDYNVAWTLASGVEFRLQISPCGDLAVISTAAGIRSHGDWRSELRDVHKTLQEQFLSVITDHAKEVWKWQQR